MTSWKNNNTLTILNEGELMDAHRKQATEYSNNMDYYHKYYYVINSAISTALEPLKSIIGFKVEVNFDDVSVSVDDNVVSRNHTSGVKDKDTWYTFDFGLSFEENIKNAENMLINAHLKYHSDVIPNTVNVDSEELQNAYEFFQKNSDGFLKNWNSIMKDTYYGYSDDSLYSRAKKEYLDSISVGDTIEYVGSYGSKLTGTVQKITNKGDFVVGKNYKTGRSIIVPRSKVRYNFY